MDNSNRFDDAIQLDATDFNSFMALEFRIMEEFANKLGYRDDAMDFHRKWTRHCDLMNEYLWNESAGFYVDYDVVGKKQSPILASAGFLPLICGAANQDQAERLVAHLKNPETFGTAFPVPSIARSSQDASRKDMWRGPTWININWLIIRGLREYGFHEEAEGLAACTRTVLMDFFGQFGTFFEYMDCDGELEPPLLPRKGPNAPEKSPYHQVIFEFGWSYTLFVDLLYSAYRVEKVPSQEKAGVSSR